MRQAVAQRLIDDVVLNGLGVDEDSLFAGDIDTVDVRPFVVLRWGSTSPGVSTVNRRVLTVWVHDTPSDYGRIDQIMKRVRVLLESMFAFPTENGWISEVEWVGDSDDLTDDGNQTILRQGNYAIIGSGG